MNKNRYTKKADGGLQIRDFSKVYSIIAAHRNRVVQVVNNESLLMIWEVGGYVSKKISSAEWGDGVVRQLSEYIRTKDPTIRGWSYRTIYKMTQFYETYSSPAFKELLCNTNTLSLPSKSKGEIVPFETAQLQSSEFVPFEMAQIPKVLFCTGWTNHQIILNRCRTNEEKLFYILYAWRENLQNKELERAIKTDAMSAILGSKNSMAHVLSTVYPQAPLLFKDRVSLDMLGLPLDYKESKLRKSIVSHMKDFILEMGKDFLFIDEEHRITIGGKTFKIDLLFYHRLLQCMVAIELKTTEFHPKDLGQLEFYLEALDQEERRSNENPSIGILLCKEANMDVVRVALNRSMSPTMVTQYKEQLQVGGVIQRSLVEFCKFINEMNEK
ncbi:MAG: PDDEXK nuclease domain-containing protein [Bacteroidales bacterium]|nr:PDDEXK nuclease domain-containing protein [Bacteroidales bacterium]